MTEENKDQIEFLESFAALDDPRQQAKVMYPLQEILLLCLCAVLSGADCWVEVALYGQQRLAFLRRFLAFKQGVPSHDQLGIVFAKLDAQQFQSCFIAWVERFTTAARGVVAVDGKTLRRSFDQAAGQGPIHMISAWSTRQRLVLGQRKVEDKSNEITAIPELLQLLELHGAVVTIDAMGCQRAIAAQIIEQEADYVLGLKGNQGKLNEDVALLFDERQDGFAGHQVTVHESCEKGHGRLETRRVVATDRIAWLQRDHKWPGLRSVAKVESRRELLVEGKVETETRYYISSLPGDALQIGHAVRSHWGVENGLHWVMDMVFRDDECRIRSEHAPANFATIKHMASNLLRRGKGKHSMRSSRHLAAWNEEFLYSLLTS
jgi:predicted transposase YbfD/YdcC